MNNAGTMYYAKTTETTEEQYDSMMDTNTKSHFFLSKDAVPYLKETKGIYKTVQHTSIQMVNVTERSYLARTTHYCDII